jgi:hypothetical protein
MVPAATRGLTNDITDHFDCFIGNPDSRVRFSYTQLLTSVGVLKEGKRSTAANIYIPLMMTAGDLSDKVLEKLSARALLDPDARCRSGAVATFLELSEHGDGDQHPSFKGRYRKNVEAMVKNLFCEGIEDGSWTVRQSWIRLAGAQIKYGERHAAPISTSTD